MMIVCTKQAPQLAFYRRRRSGNIPAPIYAQYPYCLDEGVPPSSPGRLDVPEARKEKRVSACYGASPLFSWWPGAESNQPHSVLYSVSACG